MLPFSGKRDPSIHLILATTQEQSHAWIANLTVPNLKIMPYITNDNNATFRPAYNKGNEAMVYLTHIVDFYDELADISIFTHGADRAWHVDEILQDHTWHPGEILEGSTLYAVNHLDTSEVLRRRCVSLRISWHNACPDWMHTNVGFDSEQYNVDLKAEEPYMRGAFERLFPNHTVPEILATPCCSQFAVTKEAIRSVPREQYVASIAWLRDSFLPDALSGRVWEHLWQYLFLQKAVDCPDERVILCLTYYICFRDDRAWEDYKRYQREMQTGHDLRLNLLSVGMNRSSEAVRNVEANLQDSMAEMRKLKDSAVRLGKSEEVRVSVLNVHLIEGISSLEPLDT